MSKKTEDERLSEPRAKTLFIFIRVHVEWRVPYNIGIPREHVILLPLTASSLVYPVPYVHKPPTITSRTRRLARLSPVFPTFARELAWKIGVDLGETGNWVFPLFFD